jgi:hypothetical protein
MSADVTSKRQHRAMNDSKRLGTPTRSIHSTGNLIDGIILLLLIAVEALLCYGFYAREIAWYSPSNFDQTGYLTWAYQIEQLVRTNGFGELVREIFGKGHSTGLALPIEGALAGLVVGGARLPQLLVLFVTFAALQITAFYTARKIGSSRAYGYMLVGLILSETTAWYWSGGLFDFRMDFSAYCLYGIWACVVIYSDLFFDRRWAIAGGLVGALLVLHRFLSLTYVVGVAIGFAGLCLAISLFWRSNKDLAGRMWRRFCNLFMSTVILLVVVVPILIRNWPWIYQYYILPRNALGSEKYVRALQEGITGFSEQLLFYPKSIFWDHLGLTFFVAAAVALGVCLTVGWLGRREGSQSDRATRHNETFFLQVIFLLGTIFCPLLVLMNDTDKSPIVGGIIGVPVALLVVVLAARSAPVVSDLKSSKAGKLVFCGSLVVFAIGITNVAGQLNKHLPEYSQRRDLQRLVDLDKWIIDYASQHHWSNPAISFDVLSPWLNAGAFSATGFEQSHKLVVFRPLLGEGIVKVDRSDALALVSNSDFLILTSEPNSEARADGLSLEASSAALQKFPALRLHLFPFYQGIERYREDLKGWAEKNMILAKTVAFDNFVAIIYVNTRQTNSSTVDESQ